MSQTRKTIAFLLVSLLGIYGCAKGPITPSGEAQSAREKLQRLEEDHRATVAARDQLRQEKIAAEGQQARLRQELEQARATAAREKSELNNQLKTRTAERDVLQVQYDGFRKNIKELIGQAEASLPSARPATLAKSTVENGPARN